MKKLLLILAALLLALPSSGYCVSYSWNSIVTPDDITDNWLNGFKNTTINALNSFPGGNIQSASITSTQLDNNANPEYRWGESFNEYVFTGLLPTAPGSGRIMQTPAGTAYIEEDSTLKMKRVVKDATSPQLNAPNDYNVSKDTYVDLSSSGNYTYSEVANGASTPSTAANSIRLFKVVTDATNITSVADLRVISINTSTSEDFTIKGMEIYWSSPTAISADAGLLYNGSTRISKTSATVLTLSLAADWWDGAVDSYSGAAGWCYIGIDSSGNVKFLGANPPDKHDTSGNTAGRLYYWYDATKYWRVIGAVRVNISNQIATMFFQRNNKVHYSDVYNNSVILTLSGGASTSWTSFSNTAAVPAISRQATFEVYSAASTVLLNLRPSTSGATSGVQMDLDQTNYPRNILVPDFPLSSTQTAEYKVDANSVNIWIKDYTLDIRD